MRLRVIDFESTGLPPDAAIVEVGWQDFYADEATGAAYLVDRPISFLVDPGRPIPPEASAVHHLIDSDVRGAVSPDVALARLDDGADVFVAHNAAFERTLFSGNGKPWLCTLKSARRVWPDAPSHAVQVLRYWRHLTVDRELAAPAHRAAPDALVTAILLRDLIQAGATIPQMIAWTNQPSLLPRVSFGKHRGLAWREVDESYLSWVIKQDFDEDVLFTARHELARRSAEVAA